MKLTDFNDLTEAHAYFTTQSKLVSADMMRVFMIQSGLYAYFKNHTEDLQMATYDNMSSGGEFNFMKGHASNVESLIDGMIAGDAINATALANLKTTCIAYSNVDTYEYANTTQEEFDTAVALEALNNPLMAHTYNIQGGIDYIVKTNRELIVDVIFDAPTQVNCKVDVRALLLDSATGIYVPESRVDSVNVPKDSVGKSYRIARGFAARKMKFEATCNYSLPFSVSVREA